MSNSKTLSNWPSAREWWNSLRWALLVLSIGVLAALAGSFVPYEAVLAHGHPWLPQRQCPGCALCGMTRSFCAMSSGRFDEAADWNPLGPALYLIFWLWAGGFLLIAGRAIKRAWQAMPLHPFARQEA